MVSHCSCDLHFLVISIVEHRFMCLLAICISSLKKCLFRSSVSGVLVFLFWFGVLFLYFISCLYILEVNPLLLHLQTFSSILCVVFSFMFMISFAVQKLLSLIRSPLFIFVRIFITLGGGSKKILLQFMSKSVLLMFSS